MPNQRWSAKDREKFEVDARVLLDGSINSGSSSRSSSFWANQSAVPGLLASVYAAPYCAGKIREMIHAAFKASEKSTASSLKDARLRTRDRQAPEASRPTRFRPQPRSPSFHHSFTLQRMVIRST